MTGRLWTIVRSAFVVVGIVILTSFTIDATDALNGSQSALSIFTKNVLEQSCPANTIEVNLSDNSFCIDTYENSFGDNCPLIRTSSAAETQANLNDLDCQTQSVTESSPATFVTFHQAKNFCLRREGRLPTSLEWYEAALGTPDDTDICNLDSVLAAVGNHPECLSARGVNNAVGNVWEWTEIRNSEGGLPASGYVSEADVAGVASETRNEPSELYGQDYFWSADQPAEVMIRGGFYGSESDGGVYTVHTDITPSFSSGAIGFRCVFEKE